MDGATIALKEKLGRLIREAAEVSVALDQSNGTIQGVPHYSLIEGRAHELGRQLSREIQSRHMDHLSAHAAVAPRCPECDTRSESIVKKRRITSIDGPLTIEEPASYCPRCRRAFFPPQRDVGL
jgi:hypothetical protein